MPICDKCGREIAKSGFDSHYKFCKGTLNLTNESSGKTLLNKTHNKSSLFGIISIAPEHEKIIREHLTPEFIEFLNYRVSSFIILTCTASGLKFPVLEKDKKDLERFMTFKFSELNDKEKEEFKKENPDITDKDLYSLCDECNERPADSKIQGLCKICAQRYTEVTPPYE